MLKSELWEKIARSEERMQMSSVGCQLHSENKTAFAILDIAEAACDSESRKAKQTQVVKHITTPTLVKVLIEFSCPKLPHLS